MFSYGIFWQGLTGQLGEKMKSLATIKQFFSVNWLLANGGVLAVMHQRFLKVRIEEKGANISTQRSSKPKS